MIGYDTQEPPDKYAECDFCNLRKNTYYLHDVGNKVVCEDCSHAMKQEARFVIQECEFCGDDLPLYYTQLGDRKMFICDTCFNKEL